MLNDIQKWQIEQLATNGGFSDRYIASYIFRKPQDKLHKKEIACVTSFRGRRKFLLTDWRNCRSDISKLHAAHAVSGKAKKENTTAKVSQEGGVAMPCCTYLGAQEFLAPTSDDELNALLEAVRNATGDDWRIREFTAVVRRWFRRNETVKLYELFCGIGNGEFQEINFYRPEREGEWLSSINLLNPAGYVAAFLYGVLAGKGK